MNGSLVLGIFLGFFMGMYTPVASKLSKILENQERFEKTTKLTLSNAETIKGLRNKQLEIIDNRNGLVKAFMKIRPNKSVIVEVREVKLESK